MSIYPVEFQLNKANTSDTKSQEVSPFPADTEVEFLDSHLSISNDIVSTKINDKRDDLDFEIAYFPFLHGDVPRFYPMEYISLNSFVLIEHPAM